ncbi:hypothetical protein, partial [Rodentibacter pneumotropicus]|uniref:hypothetical protein n=1 Tax=Rodentibacter pneumotropicus TaxID=758 RepID=UPI0021176596
MAKQELYRIEFFDNERNAMPYCYFELYMNGHLVTGLPPKADSQGKIWINKQWVESTPSSPKELVVRFWNSEFPKTQHSETEKFIWPEGKTSIKAFLPAVYTINTRALANENNEEQNYQRAYYLVRKGDSWEKLEAELGVNTVEALMFHNQVNYSDYLAEGMKLYYPLGFRTRNMPDSEVLDKKIEQKQSKKPEKIDKKEQKQDGEKKENTIEQRSQANGKPVDVAKPKKGECQCGKKLINAIKCTRYKTKVMTQFGPVYKGNQPLSRYTHWNRLISEGKVSQDESHILIAMSANEGNLDAVQSYDSEILTAGASQKTINILGEGELPIQMNKFKVQFPQLFDKYFKCCGWDVHLKSGKYVAYYNNSTGAELKALIRNGYSAETYGKFIPNKAVAIFAEAISTDEYKELQIIDFIDRLRLALNILPKGYNY